MKRIIAVLLCICMLMSLAACGAQPAPGETFAEQESARSQSVKSEEMSREDKELVADLIGNQDGSDLSDEEFDALIDQLLEEAENPGNVVNLSTGNKQEQPSVDVSENKDAYDENGAMTKPFDQVYPELIEKEQVAFSGESILIKMKDDTLTDGLKTAGVGALEVIVPMEGETWYEAKLTEGTDAQKALEAVRKLKEVLLAEYNYEIQTAALDHYNDFDQEHKEEFDKNKYHKDQWHMHYCGIPDAYEKMETEGGSPSVVVAVIDSGVDYTHEDLKDNMWVNSKEIPDNGRDDDGNGYIDDYYGVDIISGTGNGGDTNGHGTHVAGIIAARNNNVGVLGLAYNVKIMSVKAAMHNGTLNQADIAQAVLYAYENGAEVINMSFGGTACSIAVQDALAIAYTRCVLVASAGNNGAPNEGLGAIPNYPAALTYVLGVMSVDETGRESAFTNYDSMAFNGVEYELYAPGENIMSTLPNNQYGLLSGTSMAAPVVSAFAAILRSEFSDRDKYPTKFIYGQLASTSGNYADCLNPEIHGSHNLPQITNLNDALTKLPKPEVNLQDYALFDDPKFSDKNNGDGVIDAGETIALGLTLRNRWGMSENTQVTIDTVSSISGLADPYFAIKNPTVNYGSVGTYSTQDCGRIYTDELLTGWENPFMIEVSPDCPNDYRFTLNVTITCENALDESDTIVYTSKGSVDENVRSGYVLPSVIEKDMVLTPENLYIIPNATIIQEGVTVRVEPGTHIQFWSDDANDPYADKYIAYLLVNGKFLVEGTKEDPVYIYPSQLMDRYGVEIGASHTGYVSLQYADVTNFFYTQDHTNTKNRINIAENCTFRNNYADYLYARSLSSGVVSTGYEIQAWFGNVNARDCVFYKLAFPAGLFLDGSFDRCVFAQCGIEYNELAAFTDCVFLKNSLVDQINPDAFYNSSLQYDSYSVLDLKEDQVGSVYYREETDTTYFKWNAFWGGTRQGMARADALAVYLEKTFGGSYFIPNDWDEFEWVSGKWSGEAVCMSPVERGQNGFSWSDGTPVQDHFPVNWNTKIEQYGDVLAYRWGLCDGEIRFSDGYSFYLFEIPGQLLPEEITFADYTPKLDMNSTLQLTPISAPLPYAPDRFIYESADESVLTVSKTGLVTPVGPGTADVWVWSSDKAVKNRVTVTVGEAVVPEKIDFTVASAEVPVGEGMALSVAAIPSGAACRNVTYTSSNEAVAKVKDGFVTGISQGTATITAVCDGLIATLELTVYQKAKTLQLDSIGISAALEQSVMALPEAQTDTGAQTKLTWRSADESVAVIQDGNVVLKSAGTTSLVVTDSRSGLSAACLLIVSETAPVGIRDMQKDDSEHIVLLENGDLYHWDEEYRTVPTRIDGQVKLVSLRSQLMALKEDGTVYKYQLQQEDPYAQVLAQLDREIIKLEYHEWNGNSYYALTADGNVYAWGHNNYGQLGVGVTGNVAEPMLVNLEGVRDVSANTETTWFLTEEGKLYVSGNLNGSSSVEPVLATNGIKEILYPYSNTCQCLSADGNWIEVRVENGSVHIATGAVDLSGMEQIALSCDSNNRHTGIGIRDGKVYSFKMDKTYLREVSGITDAVKVHGNNSTYYISTQNGMLFAYGKNDVLDNDMLGITLEGQVIEPIFIPVSSMPVETLSWTDNLDQNVLTENELEITFNKALVGVQPKLYEDGQQITVQHTVEGYNRLILSRGAGFAEEVQYQLVFESGTVRAAGNIVNTEEIRISFTVTFGDDATGYETIVDHTVDRTLTKEKINKKLNDYISDSGYNPLFSGNAILNPISTDFEVSHWLRVEAPTVNTGGYAEYPLSGNYWGSTNERAIGLQMLDYTDFPNYARLMYEPYLTEAPENTFPFVTSVKLFNKYGEEVTTVGNETVTFQVKFNRDMDTSIPLLVRFGSAYPYGDYEISGEYVDSRTWEGTYTLNTVIENGYQYFSISNGCSATDDLELQWDQYRFFFEIDTTAAQALIMQGTATDTGIGLRWTQDDFDTLMGYNIYRSDAEDGYYQRLNSTVIPADTMEFFDDTVEPGKVYYYNFTVVQTDMAESEPSGKIVIMSKDTMAPNIYHSPVADAFTDANLVLDATITDNLNIAYANLYYRIAGTDTWKIVRMNKLNDKYSAIIPAQYVTMDGIEYYIEAFDGVSYTYKGSAEKPYTIAVQEAIDANALGDVDGDGVITNLDALLLLYAINDKYNLTAEEFARADLNGDGVLWAAEALRILQYVSGAVGSVKM